MHTQPMREWCVFRIADKITPGMLMAAMRLKYPVVFVSGGPMEAGQG